jgi:hypothetical protein
VVVDLLQRIPPNTSAGCLRDDERGRCGDGGASSAEFKTKRGDTSSTVDRMPRPGDAQAVGSAGSFARRLATHGKDDRSAATQLAGDVLTRGVAE